MGRETQRNILVISDLHLGEDVKPGATPVSYLRRLVQLERELETFLVHYTQTRVDGLPWRLVINGDMVDFMSVVVMPKGDSGSDEERQYGLAHDEVCTREKLDHVVERHRTIFRTLAEFVRAGNELVMVVGNHDVEFHYPSVQARFTERLSGLVEGGLPEGAVRFCPWFYYEEELVYVEHGHQYDEYCSFDYQLHPALETGGVALSLAHAGIRYFTNFVPAMDPHLSDNWGFVDYMRWALGLGARSLAHTCYFYGVFCWKALALWSRLRDVNGDRTRRQHHEAGMRLLAHEYRIAEEKLHALDGLHVIPVLRRFRRMAGALCVDRLALCALAGLSTLAALIFVPGWWRLAGLAVVGLLTLWANDSLARARLPPSAQPLRRAPEAIRRIMRAPFIVFGHSHEAETVALGGGGTYFNTGAWSHHDIGRAFTHLIIRIGLHERPSAELRQWRDGASAPWCAE